jgi:hypothetical protein
MTNKRNRYIQRKSRDKWKHRAIKNPKLQAPVKMIDPSEYEDKPNHKPPAYAVKPFRKEWAK